MKTAKEILLATILWIAFGTAVLVLTELFN